jgi:hypothetical protein
MVTGVPFSARVITETTMVLADGNHIVRQSTAFIARDSQGRTRREQATSQKVAGNETKAEPSAVFILDPVEGSGYVLDPRLHSAQRISIPKPKLATSDAVNDSAAPAPSASSDNGSRAGGVPLGTQVIGGLEAEGTRLTHTLSAGSVGNERPIEVTLEIWYSPQLQTIVMSKNTDPRFGEIVYKVTDVQLSEPDPSLFQVPVGYSVREEMHKPSATTMENDK